jgi:cytidylate kinase
MSIVAISQTLGSLGDAIGRELADTLSCEFADREIILKAADQFGEAVGTLQHLTEERPALWERFTRSRQRYQAYVEAVIWEIAARGRAVLVGRGAPFVLGDVRHALRVRLTAPERVRAARVARQAGLDGEAAAYVVRLSDRERAARIRFLYHVGWDDPSLYHLVLDTDGLSVVESAGIVRQALRSERFRPTPEGLREAVDRSIVAGVRAALAADPRTRDMWLSAVDCRAGQLSIAGVVEREELRGLAEAIAWTVAGVRAVHNDVTVASTGTRGSRE